MDTSRTHRSRLRLMTAAVLAGALVALAIAAPAASGPQPAVPSGGYALPLAGEPEVARAFEAPPELWSAGHRGVDLRTVTGALVRTPAEGVVAFVGVIAGRGVVTVTHPDGRRTTLEPVSSSVVVGTRLAQGDPVGTVQDAGSHCAPAACLHWGVRSLTDYVDPLALLPGAGPVVLLSLRPPVAASLRPARRP